MLNFYKALPASLHGNAIATHHGHTDGHMDVPGDPDLGIAPDLDVI
jgi:hypothetical protein